MLSLDDQISKFENLALTLKEDMMSVDEKFFGGGVTIKDLIQENSFIMIEMRKMKNVFLNFCKLNDKVYRRIIQHEVSASDHQNKVATISNGIERKLTASTEEMKNVKESTLLQIKKSNEYLEKFREGIMKQLQNKVAEEGFDARVKKIIIEHENSSEDELPQEMHSELTESGVFEAGTIQKTVMPSTLPATLPRKKKGLTLEDIEVFKAQITPLIDQVSTKVELNREKIQSLEGGASKIRSKMNQIKQQMSSKFQQCRINRLNVARTQRETEAALDRLSKSLEERTSENQWEKRFSQFQQNRVKIQISNLNEKLKLSEKRQQKQIKVMESKFVDFSRRIEKGQNNQIKIVQQWKDGQKQLRQFIKDLSQADDAIKADIVLVQKQLQREAEIIKKWNKNSEQSSFQRFQELGTKIQQLSSAIGAQVLKKVEIKLGKDMKEIRVDISTLNKRASELGKSVRNNFEQLTHVKDAVSSKANFTDLVQGFDRKADRQDFLLLQDLVGTDSPKQQQSEKMMQFASQGAWTRRKKSRPPYNRAATPDSRMTEQRSDKVFLLDWDSAGANKNLIKTLKDTANNKIRHKSLRTSTANTMFLL